MQTPKITSDKFLFFINILFFSILCLIEAKMPILSFINWQPLEALLTDEATQKVSSTLFGGFVSAYIFYIFIDYIPRSHREKKTMNILNLLIASVLDSYKRCRIFGHETAINFVDRDCLCKDWIEQEISILQQNKTKFLPLKFAMQTANSRLEDFRSALPLAISLSPEKAQQWLVLIDKIRIFSEYYNQQPDASGEDISSIDTDALARPINIFKSDLNLRFLEIMEQSKIWLYHEK